MDTALFKETQYMAADPLQLLVLALVVAVLVYRYGGRMRDFITRSRGNRMISTLVIILIAAIMIIIATLKLETVYYPRLVQHRFSSLFASAFDDVSMDSVVKTEMITYGVSDYGGWGMKGNEDTRAYNTSGNKGVRFTFKTGQHLMLGTHQPDTLYARVKNYYPFKK